MLTTAPIILLAAFLGIALMYSCVGLGGSSGYLAVMALMGVAPDVMKPSSLVLNVMVTTVATIKFARAGHFSWRLFWPFALLSVPAAAIGSAHVLPPEIFRPLLGVVLLLSAWRLMSAARAETAPPTSTPARPPQRPVFLLALPIGGAIGLLSGLTGTGGGTFLSPILIACRWADSRTTAAICAAFSLTNSVTGVLGCFSASPSLPPGLLSHLAPAAVVVVIGAALGSHLGAHRLPLPMLKRLLSVLLTIAGARLIGP